MSKYANDIYEKITVIDPGYGDEVSQENFKVEMEDNDTRVKMFEWLSNKDDEFKDTEEEFTVNLVETGEGKKTSTKGLCPKGKWWDPSANKGKGGCVEMASKYIYDKEKEVSYETFKGLDVGLLGPVSDRIIDVSTKINPKWQLQDNVNKTINKYLNSEPLDEEEVQLLKDWGWEETVIVGQTREETGFGDTRSGKLVPQLIPVLAPKGQGEWVEEEKYYRSIIPALEYYLPERDLVTSVEFDPISDPKFAKKDKDKEYFEDEDEVTLVTSGGIEAPAKDFIQFAGVRPSEKQLTAYEILSGMPLGTSKWRTTDFSPVSLASIIPIDSEIQEFKQELGNLFLADQNKWVMEKFLHVGAQDVRNKRLKRDFENKYGDLVREYPSKENELQREIIEEDKKYVDTVSEEYLSNKNQKLKKKLDKLEVKVQKELEKPVETTRFLSDEPLTPYHIQWNKDRKNKKIEKLKDEYKELIKKQTGADQMYDIVTGKWINKEYANEGQQQQFAERDEEANTLALQPLDQLKAARYEKVNQLIFSARMVANHIDNVEGRFSILENIGELYPGEGSWYLDKIRIEKMAFGDVEKDHPVNKLRRKDKKRLRKIEEEYGGNEKYWVNRLMEGLTTIPGNSFEAKNYNKTLNQFLSLNRAVEINMNDKTLEKSGFWGELFDKSPGFIGYNIENNNDRAIALADAMTYTMGIPSTDVEQQRLKYTTMESVGGILPGWVGIGLGFTYASKFTKGFKIGEVSLSKAPIAIKQTLNRFKPFKNTILGQHVVSYTGLLSEEAVKMGIVNKVYGDLFNMEPMHYPFIVGLSAGTHITNSINRYVGSGKSRLYNKLRDSALYNPITSQIGRSIMQPTTTAAVMTAGTATSGEPVTLQGALEYWIAAFLTKNGGFKPLKEILDAKINIENYVHQRFKNSSTKAYKGAKLLGIEKKLEGDEYWYREISTDDIDVAVAEKVQEIVDKEGGDISKSSLKEIEKLQEAGENLKNEASYTVMKEILRMEEKDHQKIFVIAETTAKNLNTGITTPDMIEQLGGGAINRELLALEIQRQNPNVNSALIERYVNEQVQFSQDVITNLNVKGFTGQPRKDMINNVIERQRLRSALAAAKHKIEQSKDNEKGVYFNPNRVKEIEAKIETLDNKVSTEETLQIERLKVKREINKKLGEAYTEARMVKGIDPLTGEEVIIRGETIEVDNEGFREILKLEEGERLGEGIFETTDGRIIINNEWAEQVHRTAVMTHEIGHDITQEALDKMTPEERDQSMQSFINTLTPGEMAILEPLVKKHPSYKENPLTEEWMNIYTDIIVEGNIEPQPSEKKGKWWESFFKSETPFKNLDLSNAVELKAWLTDYALAAREGKLHEQSVELLKRKAQAIEEGKFLIEGYETDPMGHPIAAEGQVVEKLSATPLSRGEKGMELIKEREKLKAENISGIDIEVAKENTERIKEINAEIEGNIGMQVDLLYEENKGEWKEAFGTKGDKIPDFMVRHQVPKKKLNLETGEMEIVYKKKDGEIVLDGDGNPIPEKEWKPGLQDLYKDQANKIANFYAKQDIPNFDKELFISKLLSDKRGLLGLAKDFDGTKNESLNAWINRNLKERAKDILKTGEVSSQAFTIDITTPEISGKEEFIIEEDITEAVDVTLATEAESADLKTTTLRRELKAFSGESGNVVLSEAANILQESPFTFEVSTGTEKQEIRDKEVDVMRERSLKKYFKTVKNEMGTRGNYIKYLDRMHKEISKFDPQMFRRFKMDVFYKPILGKDGKQLKVNNKLVWEDVVPTKDQFIDYMMLEGEYAINPNTGKPYSKSTIGTRKDALARATAETLFLDGIMATQAEAVENQGLVTEYGSDGKPTGNKIDIYEGLNPEEKFERSTEGYLSLVGYKLGRDPATKFSSTQQDKFKEFSDGWLNTINPTTDKLKKQIENKLKNVFEDNFLKSFYIKLEKILKTTYATEDIKVHEEVMELELKEELGEKEGIEEAERLREIEFEAHKSQTAYAKKMNESELFKELEIELDIQKASGPDAWQDKPEYRHSYNETMSELLNRLSPEYLTSGLVTKSMGYNTKGFKVDGKYLVKAGEKNELKLLSDLLGVEITGSEKAVVEGMEHAKVTNIGGKYGIKHKVDRWMEEHKIKRGEVITDPAMRQKFFEYVTDQIRNKKTGATIAQTNAANKKVVETLYNEMYNIIKETPAEDRSRVVNDIFRWMKIQSSIGEGIPKGLATITAITLKRGQFFEHTTSGLYAEHQLQLMNFNSNFITTALRNLENPKKFVKEFEALLNQFEQSIIPKELQKEIDKSVKEGGTGNTGVVVGFGLGSSARINYLYEEGVGEEMMIITGDKPLTVAEYVNQTMVKGESQKVIKELGDKINKEVNEREISEELKPTISQGLEATVGRATENKNIDADVANINRQLNNKEVTVDLINENGKILNKLSATEDFEKLPLNDQLKRINIRDVATLNSQKLDQPVKKLRGIDFDDTLATTNNLVFATKGGRKRKLTAEEFANEGPDLVNNGWKMDFSDFNVVRDGKPGPLWKVAWQMSNAIKKDPDRTKLQIVTARHPDVAIAMQSWLGIARNKEGLTIKEYKEKYPHLKVDKSDFQGINAEVVGLGDGRPEAKADWFESKVAEGYNDFYFADDVLQNVKAVGDRLDSYGVKYQVQQAKEQTKLSSTLENDMGSIIEHKTGIKTFKEYSAAKAKTVGASKGKFKFAIPYSAQDFVGLLYSTLGKGKVGDRQMAFYKESLLDPFGTAMNNMANDRLQMVTDYRALQRQLTSIPKNLNKKPKELDGWTYDQALRIYTWNTQGIEVPGLSKTDLKNINSFINKNPELKLFSEQLININKGDGYAYPGKNWLIGSIKTDLMMGLQTTKREKYLEIWQQNADAIFSDKNLNKLEVAYGPKYREALENSLYRMRTGRNRKEGMGRLENTVLDYINNSTGAIMFMNVRSAALQTLSVVNFVNWTDNNPMKAGAAVANQPQYWKDVMYLLNSNYLRDRRGGQRITIAESEILDAVSTSPNKMKGFLNLVLSKGYVLNKWMDNITIAAGGGSLYRNRINTYLKEGLSQEAAEYKAFEDFREIAEENQQSARPDKISQQQAGGFGRVILAFANTPSQYARIMDKSLKDLVHGRGDVKTNVSRLVYYAFAQNVIFNASQQALFGLMFEEEPDEVKASKYKDVAMGMSGSILRGTGIGGATLDMVLRTADRYWEESGKKRPDYAEAAWELLAISPTVGSKIKGIKSAFGQQTFKDPTKEYSALDPHNPNTLSVAGIIQSATNVPVKNALKLFNVGYTYATNAERESLEQLETWQLVALAFGYPEWQLETSTQKEAKDVAKNLRKKEQKPSLYKKDEQIDILKQFKMSNDDIEKLKTEEDRVNAILKLQKQKGKVYTPSAIVKQQIKLKQSTIKSEQEKILKDLGLSKEDIKKLKHEDDRVLKIIELQAKKKKKYKPSTLVKP